MVQIVHLFEQVYISMVVLGRSKKCNYYIFCVNICSKSSSYHCRWVLGALCHSVISFGNPGYTVSLTVCVYLYHCVDQYWLENSPMRASQVFVKTFWLVLITFRYILRVKCCAQVWVRVLITFVVRHLVVKVKVRVRGSGRHCINECHHNVSEIRFCASQAGPIFMFCFRLRHPSAAVSCVSETYTTDSKIHYTSYGNFDCS